MDLEIIILSEVSQTKKDKYHMLSLYVVSKNDTNEVIYEIDYLLLIRQTKYRNWS